MLHSPNEDISARRISVRRLQQMFSALQYRNYRLWFTGQLVSLVGTWMQAAAQGFLVFQLTHSPAYLGYVSFAAGAPSCVLMLLGGVYADRVPRQKLLIATQAIMMVLALILAGLTFLRIVQPWHIIVLALLLGVATAFDAPARLSFILEMVERKDLANAIALNSILFNLGVLVGPAVAGLVYVSWGPEWCFTINGLSFIGVIAALSLMRLKPFVPKISTTTPVNDFMEGIRYALSNKILCCLLSIVGFLCLFGTVYMTLIPAWAETVLGGDAATNGWLLSCRGLGAISGAMMFAALGRFKLKGRLLSIVIFCFPLMILLFSSARSIPLALVLMAGVGWSNMITFNLLNSLLQSQVADEYRGRIISLYTFGIFGLTPLGSLLVGWEAEYWGEPTALLANSLVILILATLVFSVVPQLRHLQD